MGGLRLSRESPRICLSLTERTIRENLEVVVRERKRVGLVELRADFLGPSELEHLEAFPRAAGLPTVLVFRRVRDGGVREIGERERVAILNRALAGGWAYVDLEDDLEASGLEERAAAGGTEVIRSFHDFSGVPEDLSSRIMRLARTPRELPKAAVMPRGVADLGRILDAARKLSSAPAIVVGMGEWGFLTRVLPGRFASVWSYSTAGEVKAAPGHVDPKTLTEIYRFGETGANAALFAVIGNPVLHTRSPWIHNPALRSLGMDAVYVPIKVDDLESFFVLADRLPINGASVTVPYKEQVRSFLAGSDEGVAAVGACNTIVRGERGWQGYNTDVEGFLTPLESHLSGELRGLHALVVGAGGAARAAVYGLTARGCRVTIVNRTERRAAELAREFGCEATTEVAGREDFDLVVQATSVGMSPREGADPLPDYAFTGKELLYEMIYAPSRTRFLDRAAAAGCRTIGGREMLLSQAYAQFRLFTGRDYPTGIELEAF